MQSQESKPETNQASQTNQQTSQKGATQKKARTSHTTPTIEANPIQTKQGSLPPIKSPQGNKPPIQARQRPVQRNQNKSNDAGSGNEAQIKANVSSITGTDVSNANIHYNSDKPAQLNAIAYAQGNDIHMSSSPGADNHTLAHELTHNAQQQTGQVKATIQGNNGVGINNDPKLEKHADDVAAKALNMPPAQMKTSNPTSTPSFQNAPVQGFFYDSVDDKKRIMGADLTPVLEAFKKSKQYKDLVTKYTEEAKVLDAITNLTTGDYYSGKLISKSGNYLNEETYVSIASAVSNVIDTNAKADKNYDQLKGKTFKELIDLTKTQADWHTQELGNKDRDSIRWALSFAREPNIETTLGSYKVDDFFTILATTSTNDELLNPLREYASVKATGEPLEIDQPATLKDVKETGERLLGIQDAVPKWMINGNLRKNMFKYFDTTQIAALKNYYDNSHHKPYFQSNRDFMGFLVLSKDNSKNPLDYDGTATKGNIRNYHRFQKDALDQLATNFGDKSKAKPLTLLIHTALDHNGAFVHDSKLTALIKNKNLLTLMLEGKESMGAYTSEIDKMASDYGQNGKIDQVMIAGHGSATSMEMGGKIEDKDGKVKEVGDNIDITGNVAATKALFDKLLDNMNKTGDKVKEPHRRILFNACLTNSVTFIPDSFAKGWDAKWFLSGGAEIPTRAQMQTWLSKNHNLVSYVTSRADAKGIDLDKVVGSMASHGQLDMFDPATNKLELLSTKDPYLTAADKKDYVINGHEPQGVFSALAVCWTNKDKKYRNSVYAEVKKRAGSGNASWPDAIIEAVYLWLKKNAGYWGEFHFINGFVFMASPLSHAQSETECNAESLRAGMLSAFALSNSTIDMSVFDFLHDELKKAPTWSAKTYLPFAFYQAYVGLGLDAYIPKLHSYIDSKYPTVADIRQHLNFKALQANGGSLKKVLGASKNNPASLKIALASVIYGAKDAEAEAYLMKHIKDKKFTAKSKVADLLVGASTEKDVLIKLGVEKPDTSSSISMPKAPTDKPNVTLESGKQVYVKPTTLQGNIKANSTATYEEADDSSTKLADLAKDEQVYILGSSGAFWAIEHKKDKKQTTAFVKKDAVRDAKSLTTTP